MSTPPNEAWIAALQEHGFMVKGGKSWAKATPAQKKRVNATYRRRKGKFHQATTGSPLPKSRKFLSPRDIPLPKSLDLPPDALDLDEKMQMLLQIPTLPKLCKFCNERADYKDICNDDNQPFWTRWYLKNGTRELLDRAIGGSEWIRPHVDRKNATGKAAIKLLTFGQRPTSEAMKACKADETAWKDLMGLYAHFYDLALRHGNPHARDWKRVVSAAAKRNPKVYWPATMYPGSAMTKRMRTVLQESYKSGEPVAYGCETVFNKASMQPTSA